MQAVMVHLNSATHIESSSLGLEPVATIDDEVFFDALSSISDPDLQALYDREHQDALADKECRDAALQIDDEVLSIVETS